MDGSEKKKAAPPYVAYKTLINFLDKFKQGVPGRIDRGLMGSMSGASQSQVTTALRFLDMISENGVPTPLMRRYVVGEEDERKIALKDMLTSSYKFLFQSDFDIGTATASMLREAFEANTSATGETLGRCMAFLKEAAEDAGIQVSPYIKQKKLRTGTGKKKPPASRREERKTDKQEHITQSFPPEQPKSPAMPAQSSLLLWGLFQRLPTPGETWHKMDREQWLQTLQNVLILEYPEN